MAQGICYLANDRVLDWLIASVNSVRANGCTVPIAVIPFDTRCTRLEQWCVKHDVLVLPSDNLDALDEIGMRFNPGITSAKMCRKFAAFWGPFETFLFLDSDIVALMDLTEFFRAFHNAPVDFLYFDSDPKFVFEEGEFQKMMLEKYLGETFSAGAFMSRRGIFTLKRVQELASQAEQVKTEFRSRSGDQSLLNYCVGMEKLHIQKGNTLVADTYGFMFAGSKYQGRDDIFVQAFRQQTFLGKRFPYIHWAGYRLGPDMPHREIFLHHRLNAVSLVERLRYVYKWQWAPKLHGMFRK